MDEIVKAAIAKWPNVPHCYGWLALDARGQWRMRDERCQALNLPGDVIRHQTLIDFINRNYQCDDQGCWYFQNGPQRVYVELEATPYIARTTENGLQMHTGKTMPPITAAYLDEIGNMMLVSANILALVDDRDLAEIVNYLSIDGRKPQDEELLNWLETSCNSQLLVFNLTNKPDKQIIVQRGNLLDLLVKAKYVAKPTLRSTN